MTVRLSNLDAHRSPVRIGWRTRIEPAWSFDLDALACAANELGLTCQVVVGCVEYPRGRWGGMYSHEQGVHRIRVRRAHTAEKASRTLWHELEHARQHEAGRTAGTSSLRGQAYMQHPDEVDARAREAEHDRLPLAR